MRSLLRIPFQAFFQPRVLENYLNGVSSRRKKLIAWGHVLLATLWFGAYGSLIALFPLKFQIDEGDGVQYGIFSSLAIYAASLLTLLVCCGLFKRDSVLGLICATYFSVFTSLLWVLTLQVAGSTHDLGYNILAGPAAVILICLAVSNIRS